MIVADFIDRLAAQTGWDVRDVELYARRLREAGLFADRASARKITITLEHAANLVLALMAAPNARQADAIKSYGELRARPAEAGETLLDFIVLGLRHAHSDRSRRQRLNTGTLSILRGASRAIFESGPLHNRRTIRFQPDTDAPGQRLTVEAHLPGDVITRLSYAIADLPEPQHLL